MSDATRILSDAEVLERRDRDAFNAGFQSGVDCFMDIAKGIIRIDDEGDSPRWDYWSPKLREAVAKAEGRA